jgi:hypothetical protein
MADNQVNKGYVSKLAWDGLDSVEKTIVMEFVRAVDDAIHNLGSGDEAPPTLELAFRELTSEFKDRLKEEIELNNGKSHHNI